MFQYNYLHHLCGKDGGPCNGIYLDVRTRRVTARGNPSELVRDPHTELQALRFLTRGEAGGPQQQD